jgi:catechol 2,3-dioxygenase-like lactoylglutathione lyase family enzyme
MSGKAPDVTGAALKTTAAGCDARRSAEAVGLKGVEVGGELIGLAENESIAVSLESSGYPLAEFSFITKSDAVTKYHGSNIVALKLTYVIEFVGNMDRAVRFYRDTIGLPLKFESPDWSEFSTGETTLAPHPASEKNPPGKIEVGFGVPDLQAFHESMTAKALKLTMPGRPPHRQTLTRVVSHGRPPSEVRSQGRV